ncbi:MAG TPA: PEP-CTERM sorting domain-containing protein [Armatimonadota bacterium]|jgi:hypothetical protein
MLRQLFIAAGVAGLLAIGSAHAVVIYDTGGFEGYAIGDIVGQDGWQNAGSIGLPASWTYNPAKIVAGPAGGKVLQFDNIDKTYSSIDRPFQNLVGTYKYGQATFDFMRDDAAIYNNCDWWPSGANPWGGLAWDHAAVPPALIQPHGGGNGETPQLPNTWYHIVILHDLINGKGSAWVNGALVCDNASIGMGNQYNGWYFDDWNTVDQARTPGAKGRKGFVDNLSVSAGNTLSDLQPVPEPSSLALLAGGLLPLLGLRRRK